MQLDALLGQVLQVEGAYTSHALPVVPPPALHHQQFVQRTAVRQVTRLEIPGRTVDVSFDVRHQQQVRQQAVAVLHLLPAVAHGNRERRLHGATFRIPDLNVQTDGVIGLIGSLVRTDRHRQGVGLSGKNQAIGHQPAGRFEPHDLRHAYGQVPLVQPETDGTAAGDRQHAEVVELPSADDCHPQHTAWRAGVLLYRHQQAVRRAEVVHRAGKALLSGFRQVETVSLFIPDDFGLTFFLTSRIGKAAFPFVARGKGKAFAALLVHHAPRHVHRIAIGIRRLEGHTHRHILHQIAAFGVEAEVQFLLLPRPLAFLRILACPWADFLFHIVARHRRLVEDGDDAREDRSLIEVQHVFGIGPHLVEAGIERQLRQGEVAVATAVPDRKNLLGYNLASRVEQFHIQRLAPPRGTVQSGGHHVALEPDVVALIIAGVVEVQGHLFLWQCLTELFHTAGQRRQRPGYAVRNLCRCNQREEHPQQKSHYPMPVHRTTLFTWPLPVTVLSACPSARARRPC